MRYPRDMLIRPVDYFLIAWFALAAASAVYVAVDQYRNNPEPVVMKWGFILVTLYTGPIGLLLYVLADKEPRPGEHEEFIKPLWKQGVGSTIHCVAGDATGIILAAVITASLGLPMWLDLIVEYIAGFAFGLLIFQSLFMKDMMGGSYLAAVKHSVLPELIFWGAMSAAVGVGLLTCYPVNAWLVNKGLKHGMGTVRALGKGGHSVEAEKVRVAPATGQAMAGME